ncbi:arsenate reductase ArsC [bacterium]|nr:arsenate reductase ArsC [bacterium]
MKKVLFLCTGNSCRSQMAEGFMKQYEGFQAFSAGTKPAERVNPHAITVMKELGIDLSSHNPKMVNEFLADEFDYVITVCDSAKKTCPLFTGKVKHRLHIGFEDPDGHNLDKFREVRDLIAEAVKKLAE